MPMWIRILMGVGILWGMTSGTQAADPPAIEGATWSVVSMEGKLMKAPEGEKAPFVQFDAEKKQATGYAGCNRFFGGYKLEGDTLRFGPAGATRRACPGEADAIEQRWFRVMDAVRRFRAQGQDVELLNENNKVLALLRRIVSAT